MEYESQKHTHLNIQPEGCRKTSWYVKPNNSRIILQYFVSFLRKRQFFSFYRFSATIRTSQQGENYLKFHSLSGAAFHQ